jgi:hypothetical protein
MRFTTAQSPTPPAGHWPRSDSEKSPVRLVRQSHSGCRRLRPAVGLGGQFVWENGAHYAIFSTLGIAGEELFEGPVTPDLEWPTWIVYAAVPLGSFLMCYRFLQVMVSFLLQIIRILLKLHKI